MVICCNLLLPHRYALDVNVERAEDVLSHKRLLKLAEDPANRPVFQVRSVQVKLERISFDSGDILFNHCIYLQSYEVEIRNSHALLFWCKDTEVLVFLCHDTSFMRMYKTDLSLHNCSIRS